MPELIVYAMYLFAAGCLAFVFGVLILKVASLEEEVRELRAVLRGYKDASSLRDSRGRFTKRRPF